MSDNAKSILGWALVMLATAGVLWLADAESIRTDPWGDKINRCDCSEEGTAEP